MKQKKGLFEDSDIDPKVIRILSVLFFGIFGIGMLTLFFVESKAGECDRSKQAFLSFAYHGKIVRTYKSDNHSYPSVVFEDSTRKELIFDYKIWAGLQPGDVLIKKRNELDFKIVRGEDTLLYKERISDCDQFKE